MTSIEWLKTKLETHGTRDVCVIGWEELDSLIEQAKELRKKEMIKFTNDYLDDDEDLTAEQYYNTIFENKENQKQLIVEIMEEDSKDGLYDIPLQECVNCNEQKQVHLMCLDCCIKLGNQNQTEISEPNPQLIESMSYRYRHDFGLLQDDKKNVIRTIMKQLWEEVVGKGFYKPTKHQVPDVRKMVEISDEEIEKIINPNKLDKIPESWKSFIDGAKWYREQLKQKQ